MVGTYATSYFEQFFPVQSLKIGNSALNPQFKIGGRRLVSRSFDFPFLTKNSELAEEYRHAEAELAEECGC